MAIIKWGSSKELTQHLRRHPSNDTFANSGIMAHNVVPPATVLGKGHAVADSPGEGWAFVDANRMVKFPFSITQNGDSRTKWKFTYRLSLHARGELYVKRGFDEDIPDDPKEHRFASASAKVGAGVIIFDTHTADEVIPWKFVFPDRKVIHTNTQPEMTLPYDIQDSITGSGVVELEKEYELCLSLEIYLSVNTVQNTDQNIGMNYVHPEARSNIQINKPGEMDLHFEMQLL